MIVACVQKIMKGECACQHVEEAEGGDEGAEKEAEQDEMLFEYAGEVLPTLGRALNPATFAPCFTGLLPMRIAIAIADSLEPLQGVLQPFLQHLLPLFVEMIKDSEDDVRNNAVYGLREALLWGGDAGTPHISTILANVSKLLQHESCPWLIDQCVGALSRCIAAQLAQVL